MVRFLEHSDSWKFAWLQIGYQLTMIYLLSLKMNFVPSWTPEMSAKDDEALEKSQKAAAKKVE